MDTNKIDKTTRLGIYTCNFATIINASNNLHPLKL